MMCIVSGSFGGGPQKVSTEDQVAAITTSLEDAESWLYDEGESTTLQAYVAKYNDVKAVADVVLVPLDLLQNPPPPPSKKANATKKAKPASKKPAAKTTAAKKKKAAGGKGKATPSVVPVVDVEDVEDVVDVPDVEVDLGGGADPDVDVDVDGSADSGEEQVRAGIGFLCVLTTIPFSDVVPAPVSQQVRAGSDDDDDGADSLSDEVDADDDDGTVS